ncbi:MAG: bifunctional ornithine acetyltransferase/N-acetylglutamate synthase [Merdibacter sp.]
MVSSSPCDCAAVYTRNQVKADPLLVTKQHLADHRAQAIIVNSGNANACARHGHAHAVRACQAAAAQLGLDPQDVLVASTGVIGVELPIDRIEAAIPSIQLSKENNDLCARAILTTDTKEKVVAVTFTIDQTTCTLGGIAKGSGMIHPNMGTMLAFLTTDKAIDAQLLQTLLVRQTQVTFNRVSVDGDTSTNDMCIVMAMGKLITRRS